MVEQVDHTLPPWYDQHSRVLILGTMPSPASRSKNLYYGHPQNRFWPTLARILHEDVPRTPEACRRLALRHGIALWDVLATCLIDGAKDASIQAPVANDLRPLLQAAPIEAIFTTGRKATDLYASLIAPALGRPSIYLPSTSPANRAHWPEDALCDAYRVLLPYLGKEPPC